MKNDKIKTRLRYAAVCFLVIVIECFIALYVRDDFIRPYIGDMLVVVPVYCLFRIMIPKGVPLMPFYAFLFAASIEAAQYFHLADLLHLSQYRFFRILLGATFDWIDILCYGLGCAGIWLWENRKRISSGRGA